MRVSILVSHAWEGKGNEQTSAALFSAQPELVLLFVAEFGVLLFALSPFFFSRFEVQSAQNHSFVSSLTTSSVITGS
jgi:hypothetical protein